MAYQRRLFEHFQCLNHPQYLWDYGCYSGSHIQPDSGANAFQSNALDELGKLKEAIADYDEAIRLNSQFANAYNNRGYVYDKLGEAAKSRRDYAKAESLNKENEE